MLDIAMVPLLLMLCKGDNWSQLSKNEEKKKIGAMLEYRNLVSGMQ
jgi:hypothetical protein